MATDTRTSNDKTLTQPTEPNPTVRFSACNIREGIRNLLRQNPKFSTKKICSMLGLPYPIYKGYVRKEACIFRRESVTHVTVTPEHSHRNKYVWKIEAWEGIKAKLSKPWKYSQTNRLWFFHDDILGSILWHNTNRIELLLKGRLQLARVKELFCHAFLDYVTIHEIDQVFGQGVIESRHHVFPISQQLPKFEIDYFAGSHGLTVYSDGSHKNAIEVSETKPFWLEELHEIGDNFKQDMNRHMALLDTMNQKVAEKEPKLLGKILRRLW